MMKKAIIFFLAFGFVYLLSGTDRFQIQYKTHTHYFVKNTFKTEKEGSFLLLKEYKDFEKVFGAAATSEKITWIKPEDFNTNFFVAIIKDAGNSNYEFTAKNIYRDKFIINFEYNFLPKEQNLSYKQVQYIIVSFPKLKFKTIQFLENGKKNKYVNY